MSPLLRTGIKRRAPSELSGIRIGFFAEGDENQQSTVHRVLVPAAGLRERGHDVSVILGKRLALGSRQILAPSPLSFLEAVSALKQLDVLLVHRTASLPTGALIHLARLTGLKTVYDFDDALYLIRNPVYGALNSCIATADLVIAGSHELLAYATPLNSRSFLAPSSVNTELFHPRLRRKSDLITIGWLGHGPLHRANLAMLLGPLKRLARDV